MYAALAGARNYNYSWLWMNGQKILEYRGGILSVVYMDFVKAF